MKEGEREREGRGRGVERVQKPCVRPTATPLPLTTARSVVVLKLEFSTWVNLAGQVEVSQYLNIDVQKGTSGRRKV